MKSKLINLAALAVAVTVVLAASPNLKGAQFAGVNELRGGGRTPSAPAAVAGHLFNQPPNVDILEAFVRGNGNGIWVNGFFAFIGFGGWHLLPGGGLTPSEPAAVIHNGVLKLFVRGLGDGIWENDFMGSPSTPDIGWLGWFPVPGGGLTPSGPAAVVHNGTLKLFVRGLDNRIWENDGNGWFPVPGGGLTPSEPAAVVHNGTLKLFVRGLDNGIWENDGSGWFRLPGGGLTLAGPSALVDRVGVLKLFVTGLDHHIWENDLNGMGWSSTFNPALPSPDQQTPLKPAAVLIFPSQFIATPLVFWTTEDGRIFDGGF